MEERDAILAGDRDAFGQIVSRYQGLVCSVTYSVTGDLDQSEDLAQETFLTAWTKIGELRDWQKLPSWLCAIARNLARSAVRKQVRDPLSRAGELSEDHLAQQDSVPERLGRAERDALLWQTLATIPEEYREPLILFYREGQSVRAVAEALDLSEDLARQRLSRGRKMLKVQVSQLVEDSLRDTRPGTVFTLAVLSALPLATTQMTVAGGLGTGAAATGKGFAGAGGAAAAAGIGTGLLGGLAGALIGMTGGFLGMWFAVRNSATLRLRRYVLKSCAVTYAFVWIFLGYQGMSGVLFWTKPALMLSVCAAGWAGYIGLLFLLIVGSNRIGTRILKEDTGLLPAPSMPLENSPLSLRRVWLTLIWTFPLALLGSAATVYWIASMPWTHALWPAAATGALLIHFTFALLYRTGLQISHDEQAFAAHPPSLTAEDRLALLAGKGVARRTSPKAAFYNDLAALAGSIFGPMMPLAAMAAEQKEGATVGIIVAVSTAVLISGTVLRRRAGRRWAFFSVCMVMGAFSAGLMALKGNAWSETGTWREASLQGIPVYLPAAIALALYWCIGLALLYALRREKPETGGRF